MGIALFSRTLLRAWWRLPAALSAFSANANDVPAVASFVPHDTHKQVNQALAIFATPMVALRNPHQSSPFTVSCPAPRRGRWLDEHTWADDFERVLPAGVACEFTLRGAIGGAHFRRGTATAYRRTGAG